MGKNMYTRHVDEEVELDKVEQHIHPSCMWGFVHAMDYHQWHFNFKRMLLQKINPRKHAKGKKSSKAKQPAHDPGELQKLLTEEEKHFHSAKELKHKRSLKTRIKSLIAEDMSEEEIHKHQASSFSPQPKLQHTYSIHHLESPYYGLGEVCTDWEHPIIFFPGNKNTGATKTKTNVTDKPDTRGIKSEKLDASEAKFKEHVNALEIFKVDKGLFLEIVQDKDGRLRKFSHTLPVSDAKARLAKSGSFPAPNLSQKRNFEPSTLKQKQTEIWSDPNVDKFKYSKFVRTKSLPLEYSMRGRKLGQALNSVLETTNNSDEGNSEVLVTSNESKQSMQFEVKESGDEGNSSSLCSTIEKDSSRRCEKTATSRVEENSFSSCETEEHCFTQNRRSHRRSSSLNESLDKYTRLFENNFGKEEVKLHPSRSLKLRNEYEMGSGGNAPIVFRRIRSLSNADIYSSLQNEVYGDANLEDWPITTVENNGSCEIDSCQDELKPEVLSPITEENVPPRHIEYSVHLKELLERDGSIHQMDSLDGSRENVTCDYSARVEDLEEEEAHALAVGKSNSYTEHESDCSTISSSKLTQTFPVPAYETYEEVSSSVEFKTSEEVLEKRYDGFDEEDSSINSKKSFDTEPSSLSYSMQNLENLDLIKDDKLGGSFENYDADSDLEYVKDILENSGITKDAFHRTWHSSDQPLDPSIFDEMEAYWHKEFSGEDYCGCLHHQLLFDLVNEKVVQINNRSFTYYPKALSSGCHIRPFPVGDRIVDEICTSVTAWMSLNPRQMRSLESLVALDMGRDDGWMNLQSESESRGLELEDMILDELLEELICS